MLFRKLWRTMGVYKAQFISMIIMICLGVGVVVGFNTEWYSIERNTDKFFDSCGYADYRIYSERGFSDEELEKIADIDGVDTAARFLSVAADIKGSDGNSAALTVTTDKDVSSFIVTDGDAYDAESSDGVWLSDKYAEANDISLGDSITFVYRSTEITGKVRGLIKAAEYLVCVRDESQLMPDYDTYGYAYISPALYKEAAGFEFYPQIHVISDREEDGFFDDVDKAIGETTLILTKEESSAYSLSRGEIDEGKTMGSVLPVLFLLIAVLTMVTTMHRLCAKEKTQIGTLKALGFKDRRILRHYTSYAFTIGIIGSAAGIGLGYGIAWYVMNPSGTMGTYFDMPEWKLYMPLFCVYIIIGIIVLLTLIGFASVRSMLRGTAADALRPYTPKKMKPMLIERTNMFHRLSFGTRWNMRDIMRHKSRTAMTLIGIIGCMMIIVCAFGMRDTMSAFLDMYYDGATNYSSRIYLSESADDGARQEVIDAYDGDWSQSISVQTENDKTVSLDIYSLSHDTVKFPGKEKGYTDIKDDGAYVCMRIADDLGVDVGDSITLSPYGTDDKYTFKVSGIIRSVSESVVITPKCAENAGLTPVPDSVYTDTPKADIDALDAVKSVQSRQAIVDSFDTFMEIMNAMIAVFVVGGLVLGVVVLYNLGVMSYTERYRELATLKVVGFKDKRIGGILIGQNLWLSVIGVILGLPMGAGVLDYALKKMASEYEMRKTLGWARYVFSIALTMGVSLLVSAMVSRKNRKIDMVEALKGAE